MEVNCVNHAGQKAVGFCSRCQKSYCSQCLDMELGQPICSNCKKKNTEKTSPAANPVSLNFKGTGLDEDPLGLFSAPSAPAKVEVPKVDPPKLEKPNPSPSPMTSPVDFGMPFTPTVKAPAPTSVGLGTASQASSTPSLSLDDLMKIPSKTGPGAPVIPASVAPTGKLSPVKKIFSLGKIWLKFLVRKGYQWFEPLAKTLHLPTYLVVLGIPLVLVGLGGVGLYLLNRPSVEIVPTIEPIQLVLVNSSQVSEMDITTFSDLEGRLQAMGFSPVMQMTIPQLPSPNFFDVEIKADSGTYGEILKVPGKITPRLSFVTVFTNGTWFSTNGWKGDNQQSDDRWSEFFPTDTPDQLYVQHIQTLDKLKQDNGWEVETMNQNRYMAALSDHLRWFLVKKDIPAYKADFALWH